MGFSRVVAFRIAAVGTVAFLPLDAQAQERAGPSEGKRKDSVSTVVAGKYYGADSSEELAERTLDRPLALCRELTKLHEQVLRGSARELAQTTTDLRGEVTLVVSGAPGKSTDDSDEIASR